MNKKDLVIFLDMDGVVANFVKSAMSALNITNYSIPPNESSIEKWNGVNVTTKEFWESIDKTKEDFWLNIEKYDYSDQLVSLCESYGEVHFLTSPSRNPSCLSGKMMWIQKYYPRLQRRTILTSNKYLLADHNRVLIDDTFQKTSKFNQFGGYAILFPQEYNKAWSTFLNGKSIWGEDKIKYIKTNLDAIASLQSTLLK
jgi:5'(3')-deoxyribonucleotidase